MANKDIKLYYFPTSYYSLKVLLALYEKDVKFKEQIVNLFAEEQNENWYLEINRNGEVPVLEIWEEHVAESDVIIDVIDNTFSVGSKLVPDPDSHVGRKVADMRTMLGKIPVDIITFGALANPSVRAEAVRDPLFRRFTRDTIEKRMKETIHKLQKRLNNVSPDMRNAVDRKIELNTRRLEDYTNLGYVRQVLNDLEHTFDKLEAQIKQTKRELGTSAEYWLCGPTFTVADITATTLMFCLNMVGLASRYFSSQRRPEVYAYYQKLTNRASVVKMMKTADSVQSCLKNQVAKSYGGTGLKIGAIAGVLALGFVGLRKFLKV